MKRFISSNRRVRLCAAFVATFAVAGLCAFVELFVAADAESTAKNAAPSSLQRDAEGPPVKSNFLVATTPRFRGALPPLPNAL